jgi:hypothetical protein
MTGKSEKIAQCERSARRYTLGLFLLPTGIPRQAAILSASSSAFFLSTAPCPNQAESRR